MIAPRRHGRARLAFFAAVERVSIALGGRAFYRRRFLSGSRFVVRRERVAVPGLPPELDGLTIAHFSDVHAGPFIRGDGLKRLVEAAEELRPDVVCFTGDFVTHTVDYIRDVEPMLGRIRGRLATVAVFGNHDYKRREEDVIVRAMEPHGWRFLRNEGFEVAVGEARLGLAGIEDPEEGKVVDPKAAMAGVRSAGYVVALSHGPQAAPHFVSAGADLVLSGHTHGTQIDLPILRRLGPPHPGLRVAVGPATLFVTRGVGAIGVPLRYRSPAELVVIELSGA